VRSEDNFSLCCDNTLAYYIAGVVVINLEVVGLGSDQGCQMFLDTIYQNGGKYTTKLPNGNKMYQIAEIYLFQMTKEYTDLFHSKALQNLPKIGFLA
jgi:hypothetical protein